MSEYERCNHGEVEIQLGNRQWCPHCLRSRAEESEGRLSIETARVEALTRRVAEQKAEMESLRAKLVTLHHAAIEFINIDEYNYSHPDLIEMTSELRRALGVD